MEVIRWLDSHSRISNKLIALVQADLREVDTVKAVSQRYHLDRQTVKAVDKLQLDHCFGEIELGNVRHLIMDEFTIQKGHKYATIVMDAETHRALWVCKGKAGVDVKAFFELLKEKKLADKIRSVSMDMNACFPSRCGIIVVMLLFYMTYFTSYRCSPGTFSFLRRNIVRTPS